MATDDKYDRQIRLWGPMGQRTLAQSRVLLLGASPVGVETVKNLVLPGIKHITIVDNELITQRDTNNNFFTPFNQIGQPRALVVQQLLCELNPDVSGDYSIIEPRYFNLNQKQYDLVVVNEFMIKDAIKISKQCFNTKTNVIYVNTQGFIGKIRIEAYDHFIIDSKPLGSKLDLRVRNPFKTLNEFNEKFQIQQMKPEDIAHIPYIIIQMKALEIFKQQNNGTMPKNMKEKEIIKQIIRDMSKVIPDEFRENFYEAINNISDIFYDFRVRPQNQMSEIQDLLSLFKDQRCQNSNLDFWILVEALRQFTQQDSNNFLPLQREIPDMKSYTETYMQLKKDIYEKKSDEDQELFIQIIQNICQTRGIQKQFDIQIIRTFIQNSLNLRVIDYRTLSQEIQEPNICNIDTEFDNFKWYIVMLSQQLVEGAENNHDLLLQETNKLCKQIQIEPIEEQYIDESIKTFDSKLHVLASIIGGMAAQESVKLITKIFIPINNTLIFNGINSQVAVYQF